MRALGRDATSWGQSSEKVMASSNLYLPRRHALNTHPSEPHCANWANTEQSLLVYALLCDSHTCLHTVESRDPFDCDLQIPKHHLTC